MIAQTKSEQNFCPHCWGRKICDCACIRGYTKMAFQKGVTQDELIEFLNVAITEGGCPGETWALKAFQAYKELQQGKVIEEEVCCKL